MEDMIGGEKFQEKGMRTRVINFKGHFNGVRVVVLW
jgi:hypothetical protein